MLYTARFTTTDRVLSRSVKSAFRIREQTFPPKLKKDKAPHFGRRYVASQCEGCMSSARCSVEEGDHNEEGKHFIQHDAGL